jgi:transposase-like protein
MEITTGVERRRQWRDEEKLRIVAELDAPGVKFSAVARRMTSAGACSGNGEMRSGAAGW